ncbi:hydroxymethylpyrimidine/phosphomethylpyrimidine kinase [Neptunitalea chrysea]|uniref:hydroxymethylpyrimidine kinase n=1 Tax=Neptunitalea chrysea TaxID=1647581 RepID=A0A9W6EVP9_9FLAO|nr:hydroxymethylpyrimidine/phosphomethylpyrimidine kinase [Neptunitalea chrysea]GLB54094.1 hydroxymethylpyrimidine/phosphomethylpyrimidine kinase [Neptunitalea chrysea]
MKQPKVLSIAGFDPSAGAGILADIKVFQHFNVYGFGVMSALTIQNESEIRGIRWSTQKEIKNQVEVIFELHTIAVVKIGITKDLDTLCWLVTLLKSYKQNLKIVWDPVLKSSGGFIFWNRFNSKKLFETIHLIDLITPNKEEYAELWGFDFPLCQMPDKTTILQKSVSENEEYIIDHLWWNQNIHHLESRKLTGFGKHGTGCILSSGIAAGLALGLNMKQAYYKSKELLNQYMLSSESLLGIA